MTSSTQTQPTTDFDALPVDKLVIDGRYQRQLNEHRVGKMVEGWNPSLLGTLEVSARANGTFAVFDGQHRLSALKALGQPKAPCIVHRGMGAQEEAELFVKLQRDRRPPTPVERFRAQVFAGDPDAIKIADAITLAGFRVGTNIGDLRAISSVERVASRHGHDVLLRTLVTIRDAWFGDEYALDGTIIGGLASVLDDYSDRWEERHTNRLRTQAPIDIKRNAKSIGLGGNGIAQHAVAAQIRKAAGLTGRRRKTKSA